MSLPKTQSVLHQPLIPKDDEDDSKIALEKADEEIERFKREIKQLRSSKERRK